MLGLEQRSEWNRLLEGARDVYFTPEYAGLWTPIEGGEPLLFAWEDELGRFLCPFRKRRIPGADGLHDITSDYGYGGPLLLPAEPSTAPELATRAVRAFDDACAELGVVAEFTRFHPLVDNASLLESTHHPVFCNETAWVDLSLTEALIWRQVRKGHRYDIRKAERLGVAIRVGDSAEDARTCYRLYERSMTAVGARPYYLFGADFFASTMEQLAGDAVILLAELGGEAIAAAMFLYGDRYCHYHFSGMDRRHASHTPNKLLMFRAIQWARERGLEKLHLGGGFGGADDDSLMRFKTGFTKQRASFHIARRVHDAEAYGRLCAQAGVAAETTGWFPAYRRP